jgi:hypothetical protein
MPVVAAAQLVVASSRVRQTLLRYPRLDTDGRAWSVNLRMRTWAGNRTAKDGRRDCQSVSGIRVGLFAVIPLQASQRDKPGWFEIELLFDRSLRNGLPVGSTAISEFLML